MEEQKTNLKYILIRRIEDNEKIKGRVVKNRLNKYNVIISYRGKEMPVGMTIHKDNYEILEWPTKEGAQEYIFANRDRLELVE